MPSRDAHDHPVDPGRVTAARALALSAGEAAGLTELLRLLVDPVRARVASALAEVDELCVGDLALTLGVSENSVSYALGLLRTAGAVRNRRAGRVVYYRLADQRLRALLAVARDQLGHP
jgi:DNA-binding transcriptional ArsR family regulator